MKTLNRLLLTLVISSMIAAIPLDSSSVFVSNRYLNGIGATAAACFLASDLYNDSTDKKILDIGCGILLGALINENYRHTGSSSQDIKQDCGNILFASTLIGGCASLPSFLGHAQASSKQRRVLSGGIAVLGGMFGHELMSGPATSYPHLLQTHTLNKPQIAGITCGAGLYLYNLLATPKSSDQNQEKVFTFKQLAGKIPQDVREITDFIKNKKDYDKAGAKMPKGILLVGPPGTGKTSIARAIAGEVQADFFAVNGTDFLNSYLGETERNIRELFEKARNSVKRGRYKKAIIFIDEIDAIGSKRATSEYGKLLNSSLTELLRQLDGFKKDDRIFFIGATNRKEDLDPALIRAGRCDRIVKIDLPDEESRRAILLHYLKSRPSEGIKVAHLAQQTDGFSCADLETLVNEAAIRAVRDRTYIAKMHHFEAALREKNH